MLSGTVHVGTAVSPQIAAIRQQVDANRRAFTTPEVKAWCARRWRFLFLNEAVKDPIALDHATRRFWDRRSHAAAGCRALFAGGRTLGGHVARRAAGAHNSAHRKTTLVACPGLLNGLLPVRDFRSSCRASSNVSPCACCVPMRTRARL